MSDCEDEHGPIRGGGRADGHRLRAEEAAFFGLDEELHRRAATGFINAFLETLKDLLEHRPQSYA